MSFSQNIKRLRTEKNLTQEQLAAALGISAQAVSKWETSETYPDGALLVPLANELGVSLDELFGNETVTMADISRRIIDIIRRTDEKEHFDVARDICWQIERGLFNCRMEIEKEYDPDEIKSVKNASFILSDYGFTSISNGKEPFFAVFPEPEDGFGHFLCDREELIKIFAALSSPDTFSALEFLYRKTADYVFESSVIARECGISEDKISEVMDDLAKLRVIRKKDVTINDRVRTLYHSCPSHKLIALFLMAREIGYKGAYSKQSCYRNKPFLK